MKLVKLAAENPRTLGGAADLFGKAVRLVYPSYQLGLSRKAWRLSQEANKLLQNVGKGSGISTDDMQNMIREIIVLQSGLLTVRVTEQMLTPEGMAKQLRAFSREASAHEPVHVRVVKSYQICNTQTKEGKASCPKDFLSESEKAAAFEDMADFLGQFNIDFSPLREPIALSAWYLNAIKTILELLGPDILRAPIFNAVYMHQHHVFYPDPWATIWDNKLCFNPDAFTLNKFSFLVLLSHELGHGIEKLIGERFSPDDEKALFALRDDAFRHYYIPLHHDFFADFTMLYLLAGEKLRNHIAKRTVPQHKGMLTLYQIVKEEIFGGKDFFDAT
jgi:hypothetical protein